ncbi:hypothetical protein QN277_020854 [Acacia crassicarpa]|uniref:RNase H type-1 domain-containing protein n=1 Tax=Acacia crassicarpa TaxID=499986 RepID=A0AAE1MLF5_9FABA|nr:hypothetical protein QN277_020854 [Acacia crassicarpa]
MQLPSHGEWSEPKAKALDFPTGHARRGIGDPPPVNTVRIDVDESIRQHHQAACGGVLRNSQGEWLMGYHKTLGLRSIIEAEIYAILLGFQIGLQMNFQRIVIYSDSLDAINILMRDSPPNHPLKDIIGEARDLLFRDWNVELHYTSRDNISCADFMAK